MKSKPARPTLLPKQRVRLTGDDLYTWGQIVLRTQMANESKNGFALAQIEKLGYEAGPYLLTDDGYVITREEAARLQPQAQSSSASDASETDEGPALP